MRRFIALAAAAVLAAGLLTGCGGGITGSSIKRPKVESEELQFQAPAEGDPIAIFNTSAGEVRAVLYPDQAPMAVENFTRLAQEGYPVPAADQVQGEVLTAEEETALVRTLAKFPEEIHTAARDYDPSRINRYLTDLAGDFHRFYGACRIKGEEPALLAARLKLADSVRSVLANGLNLLGVTAPEKM